MAKRPSIKGSIVATHAEYLAKYLETAQVEPRVLQQRFEPGDLDILRAPVDATAWYDIELYRRMMEFMRDYPGDGNNGYLIDAGRRSAENLIRAGIHQQFEYLRRTQHAERTDARERFMAFGRDLRSADDHHRIDPELPGFERDRGRGAPESLGDPAQAGRGLPRDPLLDQPGLLQPHGRRARKLRPLVLGATGSRRGAVPDEPRGLTGPSSRSTGTVPIPVVCPEPVSYSWGMRSVTLSTRRAR